MAPCLPVFQFSVQKQSAFERQTQSLPLHKWQRSSGGDLIHPSASNHLNQFINKRFIRAAGKQLRAWKGG